MKKNYLLLLALFLGVNFTALAQGSISGLISDNETGEEIIGATIYIPSLEKGAATDIFGKYFISKVPAGVYALEVSYISYQKQIVQNVIVKDGEITELNVNLAVDADELDAVVVTAESIKNSTEAILSIQKKAIAVQDGISIKEIKKMGASNAAESMKYVTGASVEGGKYMVVRGLGDRYSITQMNGVTMPSTDPYRNSTSLDLIPSDMIDNLITVKTFTPDQPGNFTGGKLDITTKSLPDEFYLNVGVSTTYNTQSNLKSGFLTDASKSKYEYLGYDDGTRKLPSFVKEVPSFSYEDALKGRNDVNNLQTIAKSLSNTFVPNKIKSPLNYKFNLSTGNRLELFGKPLGYNLGVVFSKKYTQVLDGKRGVYELTNANVMDRSVETVFSSGQTNTQLGGIASLSYQLDPNHEISLINLYSHKTENKVSVNSGYLDGVTEDEGDVKQTYRSDKIDYVEKTLNNTQLSGKHYFENLNGLKIDWVGGYTFAEQDQPDLRIASYIIQENTKDKTIEYKEDLGSMTRPSHFFRKLEDQQINFKLDVTYPLGTNKDNLLKVGGNFSNKNRIFNESVYTLFQPVYSLEQYNGLSSNDLNKFYDKSNFGVIRPLNDNSGNMYEIGNYYRDGSNLDNSYEGQERVIAAYAMTVYNVTDRLKAIAGVRLEDTFLESINLSKLDTGKVIKTDFLPSLNLVYKLNEKSNIRGGYSHTVARPNMREISSFQSVGAPDEPSFVGNKDLKRTLVKNVDLRYEFFPKGGELMAVSAYYKHFTNPIFLTFIPAGDASEIKPINVESGEVYGIELELRKKLDFISSSLESFTIASNASFVHSTSPKSDSVINTQNRAGKDFLGETRPFQGQSPFIINLSLSHHSNILEWDNSLSYNTFGKRLAFISKLNTPDVYEQGRGTLNFVSTKKFGDHLSVSFKASNLLDPEFKRTYKGYENYINQSFRKGRSFSLSLSYKL